MSKGRKNQSVEEIKNIVNEYLRVSTCSSDRRQGQMDVLETILHHTGNYKGFNYLYAHQVPVGHLPGIIVNGTVENTPYEERFPEGKVDRTRVYYYYY